MTFLRNIIYLFIQVFQRLLNLLSPVVISAVELESEGAVRTYQLDQFEISQFQDEFKRVTLFPPGKGIYEAVAPDCFIRLQTNKGNFEYRIYGQTVLYDPVHDHSWQFYFGLMLLERLNQN